MFDVCIFFFKQKTAYELRISDWSSDVCSSDLIPVIAANRIGEEDGQIFYGHSFITDEWGDFVAEAGSKEPGALVATLDLDRARKHRAGMGFFRDRRPELYGRLVQDI